MKTIKVNYKPTEKQKLFHKCGADEVLYGGAAGGGKSIALVMDALDYALRYPNSNIVLFRRTYPELEESLIQNALKFYPREIYTYNESKKVMKLINGSRILFRYMEKKNDETRYQGAEFQYIGFDELTHFSKKQYEFLKSRLRGSSKQPKYIRATANPDPRRPINNQWIKEYFVEFAPPYKIGKDKQGRTRCYIPANVYDNPYLMENDPDYIKRLESLPELEKQAFLYGNWDIKLEGLVYDNFDPKIHIKEKEIKPIYHRIAGLDFGATNPTAVVFIAFDGWHYLVYDEIYSPNILLDDLAKMVKERNPRQIYADPSGKGLIRELQRKGLSVSKADNDVLAGIMTVKQLLQDKRLFISEKCENLLFEIQNYVWDKEKEKPLKSFDHALDALRYAIHTFHNPKRKGLENKISAGIKEDYIDWY